MSLLAALALMVTILPGDTCWTDLFAQLFGGHIRAIPGRRLFFIQFVHPFVDEVPGASIPGYPLDVLGLPRLLDGKGFDLCPEQLCAGPTLGAIIFICHGGDSQVINVLNTQRYCAAMSCSICARSVDARTIAPAMVSAEGRPATSTDFRPLASASAVSFQVTRSIWDRMDC